MLKTHLLMGRRARHLQERADQYRRLHLQLRALRVFQRSIGLGPSGEGFAFYYSPDLCLSDSNLRENDASFATVRGYGLARRKRLSFMFRYLQYGIKLRTWHIEQNEKAYDRRYQVLAKRAILALRMAVVARRKVRSHAAGLRKIHLRNLGVKSFSALLFHARTTIRERKLNKEADGFIAKRYYDAWARAFKWQVEVSQRVAFFQKRWRARMQKTCLREMRTVSQELLRLGRTHAKVRRAAVRAAMAEFMGRWKEAFVTRQLEERLTTFRAFRALRQNCAS